MKVALLGSYTLGFFPVEVDKVLEGSGISTEWYVGPFDQYRREILQDSSPAKNFGPKIIFLFLQAADFLDGRWGVLDLVQSGSKGFPDGMIMLHNCVQFSPKPLRMLESNNTGAERLKITEINRKLVGLVQRLPNVKVLDLEGLVMENGLNRMYDPRLYYLARMPFSRFGLKEVAGQMAMGIRAVAGKRKKCLVLDLDGVLWGGTLAEEGMEKIKLGPEGEGRAFWDFQMGIKELATKGTILAICSKNDAGKVMKAIKEHPHMVLREDKFAAFRINWQDKASNIKSIAEELNLGLDSLVFLDNSEFERELVRKVLPEVAVPDLPADSSGYPEFLAKLPYFETFLVTSEDIDRGKLYVVERKRKERQADAASYEGFLKSLKIRIKTRVATKWSVPRIAQLCQKTNQFNLSLKRYTESDIRKLQKDVDCHVLSMAAKDDLGDLGIVGVGIWEKQGGDARLDSFLMSCRVLGRGMERAFLSVIGGQARRVGAKRIVANYVATGKNNMVAEFLLENGFSRHGDNFTFNLKNAINCPEWIKLLN